MSGRGRMALFDLDGTLLSGDTDTLWCEFLIGEGVLDRAAFSAANREVAERYAAGAISPGEFCAFYAATLSGRTASQWQPLRNRFVESWIVPRIPAAARELVGQHRRAGDRLVLTTATNRFLAEPIAHEFGIGELVATELARADDVFTGRTAGVLNMRQGKVDRLRDGLAREAGPAGWAEATFYSDSINDLPLLAAVGRPVAVDPDAKLAGEAQRRGWPVLHLVR
ncbi:MAG: HAD family phosphatase [Caldimonas sp.]